MAGVLVTTVTVGLLAAGFAVFHHSGGNNAAGNTAQGSSAGRSGTGSAHPADPATLSRDAAAWVAAQVGLGQRHLLRSRDVPGTQGPPHPGEPAVHAEAGQDQPARFGGHRGDAYPAEPDRQPARVRVRPRAARAASAPESRQIQVRSIALHGTAAYESQVKKDLAARKMFGSATGCRIRGSWPPRRPAGNSPAGEVDSRLMTVITGLAAHYPVHIVSFGEAGPGTAMAPFRSAELAGDQYAEHAGCLRGNSPGSHRSVPRTWRPCGCARTDRAADRFRRAEPVRPAGIGYRQRRLSPRERAGGPGEARRRADHRRAGAGGSVAAMRSYPT